MPAAAGAPAPVPTPAPVPAPGPAAAAAAAPAATATGAALEGVRERLLAASGGGGNSGGGNASGGGGNDSAREARDSAVALATVASVARSSKDKDETVGWDGGLMYYIQPIDTLCLHGWPPRIFQFRPLWLKL